MKKNVFCDVVRLVRARQASGYSTDSQDVFQ